MYSSSSLRGWWMCSREKEPASRASRSVSPFLPPRSPRRRQAAHRFRHGQAPSLPTRVEKWTASHRQGRARRPLNRFPEWVSREHVLEFFRVGIAELPFCSSCSPYLVLKSKRPLGSTKYIEVPFRSGDVILKQVQPSRTSECLDWRRCTRAGSGTLLECESSAQQCAAVDVR